MDKVFFKNKKILVTGHTGFKGSWMCKLLQILGAEVIGYALDAPTMPSMFDMCHVENGMTSILGDVRNKEELRAVFQKFEPEIVIHMAAQPIVRESYANPVYTYETNVMGTVNVLENVRMTPSVRSVVNVTTGKVYKNREWHWGYREDDELNGYDPYSNSKSCSELVTSSYINSFFSERDIAVSTCRAGNVIGGGDFAANRIIPDCIRAVRNNQKIIVRNPYSIRPYQHVLEPVVAYLMVAKRQYEDRKLAGCYNVGPSDEDCYTTGELVSLFCDEWGRQTGTKLMWENRNEGGPHESNLLKLDCSKIRNIFRWKPVWNVRHAMEKIVEWNISYMNHGDVAACVEKQIKEYLARYQCNREDNI